MDVTVETNIAAGQTFKGVQVDLPAVSGKAYQIEDFEVHTYSENTTASVQEMICALSSKCSRTTLLLPSGQTLEPDILGSYIFDSTQYAKTQAGGLLTRQSLIDQPIFYNSFLAILATGNGTATAGGAVYMNIRLRVEMVRLTNELLQLLASRQSGCT